MKNSTFSGMYRLMYISLLLVLFMLLSQGRLYAQSVKVYATNVSTSSNTDLSANAVDANLATKASVRASSGLALGIGAYSGYLELQYATILPANTTSYVKIQTDDNLLPALLGGSLGGLLSDVLGTVLIGNQEFTIQAKNGGSVVLQGDSEDIGEFATNRLKIVTDATGNYYVAITPSQAYNRIRLTNRLGSLVGLFNVKNLDVYDAFYISGADNCGKASLTSYSGSGISLDLLSLGNAGVDHPENVLDANTTNFSRLSLGILAVAGSIEQTVYFDGLSEANDQFNIRMKIDPALLGLGVVNNIQLVASNGPNVVQTANLSALLNLDLLTLLQGNQIARIPFQTSAPANRITIRYNSLLNVQLTQSLDLYDVIRVPKNPVITNPLTLNARTCSGSSVSLVANTAAGYELHWYANAQGGTSLATTNSGAPYVTANLTSNASFYVAAAKIGCPEESARVRVNVQVVTVPVAADINIGTNLTACQGNITLTPTSAIGGATIKYYTSQNKTQEITTGYSGDAGVTYVKDPTTGFLSITGLNAINSPYTYYISLTADGLCENAANTLKEVVVNFSGTLALDVQNISGCGSANLRDAILNFDASNTYTFFDAANAPISAQTASHITTSGTYYIQAQNAGVCLSSKLPVIVTITPQPVLAIPNAAIVTTIGNSATLNATSANPITWYNSTGVALASNIAGPFNTAGIFTFTAIAVNGSCSATGSVTVTVIDPANCPALTARVYADTQSWSSNITGGVSNSANAVDGNIQSYSTITTGIGLLGIGTTWQTLQWNQTITAGTPVTLKLGSEYSGVTLAGGFSVIGTKRNGSGVPIPIGNLQPVSGSLLDLLPGQNTFEFTFVPSNNSGPKDYDGVRIVIGSLVSVAQNAKVFEAYYNAPVTQVACAANDAEDVLYGAVDLGIGAATSTVGVDNPYDAIDASTTSYATMFSGLGVLAAAEMTVVFRTPSIVSDTLKIRVSRPATLLTATVLNGIVIQPMLHNAPVGTAFTSSLLTVRLLNGGQEAELIMVPNGSFDRVRIRFGGVAGVLDFLRIHDIEGVANTHIDGADDDNAITACQGETISLEADAVDCTTFVWYDAETGGNVVSTGNTFTVPADLPQGTYNYYIQPVRFGCEFMSRGKVTITVTETAPQPAIASVSINGANDNSICSETGTVVLNATLNATMTITNPVFYWYGFDGTTQTLIAGQTTSTLTVIGLVPGTYTYFVGLSADEFCQTAVADRTEVTFTILPSSVATNTQAADTAICLNSDATITATSTLANPQFSFYFTNDLTQPITNGTVSGVTYTVSNGTLTISGLSDTNSPYTYYVAMTSDTTCINLSGNLEAVTVTVGALLPPTTTDSTQNFCLTNSPTVADIQFNEPNVIFYDAATGGNIIPPTTVLTGGIYYATLNDGTCESISRLAITVTLGAPATPTTGNATQNFCQVDNPTVANIQVNETNVTFYDALVGGNVIPSTTPLTAGIYYATIIDGACESLVRLAITITISSPATPTTDNAAQNFCMANSPTVADIQIDEPNVAIYTVAVGGTALAPTTPLSSGTYYATLIEAGTNCESPTRLEITVTITTVGTPTTNSTTQHFCQLDNPTVSYIQVNEPNVIFYDAASGGNTLAPTLPLTAGLYYASLVNGICESETRLAVTITIGNPPTPTTTHSTQNFCQIDNPTVGNIQINETNVVFYDAATGGNAIASTTPLTAGTYYVTAVENGCESVIRLAIAVTIGNPATPTTNNATQNFCQSDNPTVGDLQVNETNIIFYDAATGGNQLSPTTALTAGTYYVASTDGTCESVTRLAVVVTISNPATPTTNDAIQHFCQGDNPTVANIQVNESNVVFYDAATGGNQLVPTTPLTAGTYYAALVQNDCESGIRLLITVTIGNPATPTTNATTQNFCLSDSPTLADIQVNESNIIFYDAPTGGNVVSLTTPLVAGIYYASIAEGNCENPVRLAITITIGNPATPTTDNATQNFCEINNPTIADLEVNETGVIFFNVPTGGTPLPSTTVLVAGIYYAGLSDGTCSSAIRLPITVTISGANQVTITGGGNSSCFSDKVTYTTDAGNTNYVWTVIGGTITSGGQPGDNFVTVQWNVIGSGSVNVTFTSGTCGNTQSSLRLVLVEICSDITIAKTVDNPTPSIDDNVTFTITVVNNGTSQFTDVVVHEQMPNGYEFVSVSATNGTYSTATGDWIIPVFAAGETASMQITAKVLSSGNYMNTASVSSTPTDTDTDNNVATASTEPICLIVYNEFSPNNDGNNDVFRVDCLENYPNNNFQVHNRYGVTVYKVHSLQNNTWDGTANVNSPINGDKKLPSGTYYYILELGDGNGTKTGWLYIIR